jgi:hypothetical protein
VINSGASIVLVQHCADEKKLPDLDANSDAGFPAR